MIKDGHSNYDDNSDDEDDKDGDDHDKALGAAQSLGLKYYQEEDGWLKMAKMIMMKMTIVMMRVTKLVMIMVRHWVQRRAWVDQIKRRRTMTIVMMRMTMMAMIMMRHWEQRRACVQNIIRRRMDG